MFEKTDKRRLYWVIDQFLEGIIDARTFCDEFYYCYDQSLDLTSLTEEEKVRFMGLSEKISRFSPYEEDHIMDPKGFVTLADLRKETQETKNQLSKP